jgi:two-component system, chemotaxis family, sensor histidine kinase and response regulator WspE
MGSDLTLVELFRMEVENHYLVIEEGLLTVEQDQSAAQIEPLMRAAHSIKGAARIVGFNPLVDLSHVMEDMFVACQEGQRSISTDDIDLLLEANDYFKNIANTDIDKIADYISSVESEFATIATSISNALKEETPIKATTVEDAPLAADLNNDLPEKIQESKPAPKKIDIPNYYQDFEFNAVDDMLLDLFRIELENNAKVLEEGLLYIEQNQTPEKIEPLMRAAHSIKGAGRIVSLQPIVELAHAMEDLLVAAQEQGHQLNSSEIDLMLKANDIFSSLSEIKLEGYQEFVNSNSSRISFFKYYLGEALAGNVNYDISLPDENEPAEADSSEDANESQTNTKESENNIGVSEEVSIVEEAEKKFEETPPKEDVALETPVAKAHVAEKTIPAARNIQKTEDSVVRVLSDNLNRIVGLAGECLVQSRSAEPLSKNLLEIKSGIQEINSFKEMVFQNALNLDMPMEMMGLFEKSTSKMNEVLQQVTSQIESQDTFSSRLENLTERLYNESLETRMKPFSEGLHGFKRMIRDLGKKLGKKAELVIEGEKTRVDRDILEKLESPLTHLVRNALDHGMELPEDRLKNGKPEMGTITLEARHSSGMLMIIIRDDGGGINTESLKKKIVENNYTTQEMADNMTDAELLEFLFLPGFSTKKQVTEISGRGVGLDVVFSMVHEVGGTIRAESTYGEGTEFVLQLPLTLSVIRSLLVTISSEIYSLPLTRIERVLMVEKNNILSTEGKQYFRDEGENIGLVSAGQVFGFETYEDKNESLNVVILSDRIDKYGIIVDSLIGEKDIVVTPLDKMLGRIPNVSAGAIMEDGSPLLVIDVNDLVRSIDKLIEKNRLRAINDTMEESESRKKKVLVVDDSMTVREVERKILQNNGYEVVIAVDGIDGWNTIHREEFDLVISDIDMPRMNGIDLVKRIKNDSNYKTIPVMIVSYKDRIKDKKAGLDAGANYYLTKSSFHDETLINAVEDLIGKANS